MFKLLFTTKEGLIVLLYGILLLIVLIMYIAYLYTLPKLLGILLFGAVMFGGGVEFDRALEYARVYLKNRDAK